ncbi:unnamed protein product [Mytilus coruscus]|uniref:Endonuclease/exonuclease/phosphatase domain-containing protein n=1 Tax=Mytilus coruscus TaxID=42192 RepID=A0A6J8BH31_MYTCO|nr:unnamed protein product [Mytilus coruscus]
MRIFKKLSCGTLEGLSSEKANDPHFQDIVSKLSIASFVETWLGDFNAYTNTQLDFIEFDNVTELVNLGDSEYHPDRTLSRNNLDHKHTNNSGKLLLNMCKETKIRILNGRTTGDLNGQPTCITYNGSSLVDYTLTSEELIDSIGYFVVHDFTSLSNHRPIS